MWTGCSNYVEYVPDEPAGRAIGFSCGTVKSRAQEIDNSDDMTSFRVSAVWAKAAGGYMDDFMDRRPVQRIDGIWKYSPVLYMPTDGGTVDFFAYSPADATVGDFNISGENHDMVSITYSVTTDPASQHDFMVAEALGVNTPSVSLDFRHVLSSVRVGVRSTLPEAYTFQVYEVKLLNLNRRGVLTGITSDSPGKTTSWTWNGWSEPTAYTIAQKGPVKVSFSASGEYTPVSDPDAGPLMILPQTVSKGNKNDVVSKDDIKNGEFPSWMLGLPKDVGTSFYIAITYEIFDSLGSQTGYRRTGYFPIADPGNPDSPSFTFGMGEKYVLHISL